MRRPLAALLLALATALSGLPASPLAPVPAAAETPEALLLRFPDIHGDFVVFVYAGDIWRAPAAGGTARRLTSHEGLELFPKISPDGSQVAYCAEYSGTRQVYVIPAEGGTPRQLTWYNDVGAMPPRGGWDDWVLGWTPDGKILVRMNRTPWGQRRGRYYLVDPDGGLEEPLPIPEGGSASLSPDGGRLAWTFTDREFRTWKHHMGGLAQDIWIYDLRRNRSQRVTTWRGTDNFPMWVGETLYFTSDREHTLNLFAHDLQTGATRQVTRFSPYDVLWPSLGPKAIVFMNGGRLYRLDLQSEETSPIPIRIGTDLPATVPHFEDVSDDIDEADVSPDGKRAVFAARGDLFTVPAKDGPTRNLTRSQGVRETGPAWSPDGRWIVYLSDASGEYELYLRAQDGSGEPRALTRGSHVYMYSPVWSPDSKKLAFGDRRQRLRVLDVDSGRITDIDHGRRGDLDTYVWSPDSRWLAYETFHDTDLPGIAVANVESGEKMMLGDGLTSDFDPVFSKDGRHLFFLSERDYNIRFSSFEFNYLYDRATRVFATALDPEAEPLFPPKSDEVTVDEEGDDGDAKGLAGKGDSGDKGKKGGKGKNAGGRSKKGGKDENADKEKEDGEMPEVKIVASGFVDRTVALPGLESGDYRNLAAAEGAVFYIRSEDDGSVLYRYDLKERKEEKVLDGVSAFALSADGKKLFYASHGSWGIADAKAGLSAGAGQLDLSHLRMKLDPRAEWKQMFEEAWRIGRDWFYDPDMHGVDWEGVRRRYEVLLPYVAHRSDLDFLLGEMAGELQSGHVYVQTGDEPRVDRVEGGLLGCTFEADDSGRFRIGHIYPGENWDDAYRSPLTEPGVDVSEGDFLLAIDGEPLTTKDNPYRLLEGKSDQPVVLTLNERPREKGARKVTVRPVASEARLRYLDWVRGRMALADRLSGGRVGYLHLPDTAFNGNRMLQKLFYSQVSKDALIVDDRYNGGGFIPDRMIEMLSRTTLVYWARRGIESFKTPGFAHDGPKVMLTNGYSGSGGDALPYFFRLKKLGPVIGTRTWGGLIGLSGNPMLVDGGGILFPTFRIYDTEGNWVVENEGVVPDIEVYDVPEGLAEGDPGLEKAVEVLLEALEQNPPREPERPKPPKMRG